MKKFKIISSGSYEDYKEEVYYGDKLLGSSWRLEDLLENICRLYKDRIEIETEEYLPNKVEYVTTQINFEIDEPMGTWFVLENGMMGLVVNDCVVVVQSSIDEPLPTSESVRGLKYKPIGQACPEN
jgi:hypothetical protein